MKNTIFIIALMAVSLIGNTQSFNNSILLNGTTDYITVPDNSNLNQTSTITVEARIKLCDTSDLNDIVSKNWCTGSQNAYTFRVRNGKLEWAWDLNTCADGANTYRSNDVLFQENIWYHVAVVHTTSSVTLYVNGVPVSGSLISGNYSGIQVSNQPLLVGAYRGGSGGYFYFFKGLMDEVRIWNYDVSSTNILANYNTELTGSEAGLVLYYDMNSATGAGPGSTVTNQATLTGANLDGNTVGSSTTPSFVSFNSSCFSEPIENKAILLNGSTDYITTPDNSNLNQTSTITVEAKIKLCDTSDLNDIVSKNWCTGSQNAYTFRVRNGKLEWAWDLNTCADGANAYRSNDVLFQENIWYHVAVVHTTSSVTLYVNGVPVSGSLISGNYSGIQVSNQPLLIGAYRGGSGGYFYFFKGLMDEVRIWNYDVSSTNIFANYNTELTGSEAGLVLYYDMNSATGAGQGITVTNKANSTGSILNGMTVGSSTTPSFVSNSSSCPDGSLSIIENSSDYLIYPNPTNGELFVDFGKVESDIQLKIVNNLGQEVFSRNYQATQKATVNFGAPKGVYFLQITNSKGQISASQLIKN